MLGMLEEEQEATAASGRTTRFSGLSDVAPELKRYCTELRFDVLARYQVQYQYNEIGRMRIIM